MLPTTPTKIAARIKAGNMSNWKKPKGPKAKNM